MRLAPLGLLAVTLAHVVRHVKQRQRAFVAAHEQVAEVCRQAADEMVALEALAQYLVESEHRCGYIAFQQTVREIKIIVVVENIEVFDDLFIGDIAC